MIGVPFSQLIIAKENISKASQLIENAKNIAIVSHFHPDGDAIGSSLGLCLLLNKIGKKANVVLPSVVPEYFKFLPGFKNFVHIYETQTAEAQQILANADLLFCLDFHRIERVEKSMAEFLSSIRSSKKIIMIDHHEDPDLGLANVTISHPEMSSTCELTFRFICRLGFAEEVDINIATCILTGIITDTGVFAYNSNSADLYGIVQALLSVDARINKDDIVQKVNGGFKENRLQLISRALGSAVYVDSKVHKCKAAIMILTADDEKELDCRQGDTEGIVNMPMQVKDIKISVLLREDIAYNQVKISLRSQDNIQVNTIAAQFGGGGHINAAGAEVPFDKMSIFDVRNRLIEILSE